MLDAGCPISIVSLAIAIALHVPFLCADEPAGHNHASTGHTHNSDDHAPKPVSRTHTEPDHAHTPAGYEYMEEIVVTGDPLGDVDAHLMMPVQVLGRDELESRSIRNIGEAVANELGVTTSDFGTAVGRPVIPRSGR